MQKIVDGILFWPTQSLSVGLSNNNINGEILPTTILQNAFVYEEGLDEGSLSGQYLQVKIDNIGESGNDEISRNNCIMVSGYISADNTVNPSQGEDVIKFEHIFVTNYQRKRTDTIHYNWSFEDQTPGAGSTIPAEWVPSATHNAWVNGIDCCSNVNDTWDGTTTTRGYTCRQGSTPSTGTGPTGGSDPVNGFVPNASYKYVYTEASSEHWEDDFIMRSPRLNFPSLMNDTSNNLDLKFRYSNYSSTDNANKGRFLKVYIYNATTSNESNATLLQSIALQTNAQTDPYIEQVISLNSYRTISSDLFIFFVTEKGTIPSGTFDYKNDLAIDIIQIVEDGNIEMHFEQDFTQELASGPNGTLITSSSINYEVADVINSPYDDPIIKFRLYSDKSIYVRGTYLLM